MINRMAYCLIFLLILLKSCNISGSLRRKENYDLSRNKVINVLEKPQVSSEKNILVKRQVVIPIVTQSQSLLPIFGNMCGLVLCCDASCCCGNNYDTYDYDYYGLVVQPWPFYFMGGIYG